MRWKILLAGLTMLSGTLGCSMCANPYEDCGPVVDAPYGFHSSMTPEGNLSAPVYGQPQPATEPPPPTLTPETAGPTNSAATHSVLRATR